MDCRRIDQLKPGERIILEKSVEGIFESYHYENGHLVVIFTEKNTGERYKYMYEEGRYIFRHCNLMQKEKLERVRE